MSHRAFYMTLLLLGLALLAAGCIQTSSEPEIVRTRIIPSPEPLVPPAQFNVAEGAATYQQWCQQCHGETGLGDGVTAAAFTCPMPKFADRADNERMEDWYETAWEGNGGQPTCLMPPWNQRLTTDQVWNVVAYAYTLNYGGQSEGADIVAEMPAEAADSQWQIETSDADIINFVQRDLAQRPLEDQQAALAYIRAQVHNSDTEVAAVPDINTTPEPEAAVESTPAPNVTEEPGAEVEVTAEPAATFNLGGTVINGTAGAALPENLILTLRVVGIGADGNPEELFNAEASTDPSGTFSFNGVPRAARALGSVQTEYAGIRQFTFVPTDTEGDSASITFTIYETTTDPSNVRIQLVETYVDAVTAENASLLLQSFEFINTGDRAYIGENGRTMTISLPDGSIAPQVQGFTSEADRFEQVQEGETIVFYDSVPLLPNAPERIDAAYNLRYPGSMEIEQRFAYPVDDLGVYVSESRGLELESTQLTPGAPFFNTSNGINYDGYLMTSDILTPGTALQYRVFDGEPPVTDVSTSSSEADDESFLQENTPLILGIGVLLVVAGGMFLIYDLQKARIIATQPSPVISKGAKASKNELIAEIAALDAAYEAGRLDEASYQRQRDMIKELLREKLE